MPPMVGGLGLGRDRAPPGPQSWSSGGDSGGRPEPRGYPQQRAPSGRTHYGQDGRGYGLPSGRDGDGSPFRDEGASGGGMHGHRLRESDFPLEMGGTPKPEKPTQLRPRGEECWIFGTALAELSRGQVLAGLGRGDVGVIQTLLVKFRHLVAFSHRGCTVGRGVVFGVAHTVEPSRRGVNRGMASDLGK